MPATVTVLWARGGVLPAGGRRGSARLERPRSVLRRLAHLSRDSRPLERRLLRRCRERVARSGCVAERGQRRELDALERGALVRQRRVQALQGLGAHSRARTALVGAEAAGLFESRDRGATWSLLSTLDGQPGRVVERSCNQPPGHLGDPATLPHTDEPRGSGRSCRASGSSRRPTTAPLDAAAAVCGRLAPEDPEVGYRVHKLVMAPVDTDRMYQQNHVGMHRSDDADTPAGDHQGLPTEFGFSAAVHPHDRDTFYVIPLDPGHGRCMPEGQAAVWRTRDAGSSWQRLDKGLPERDATSAFSAKGSRSTRSTRPACTSGRAPARCSQAPTRATRGTRSRATCRICPSRSRSPRRDGRRPSTPNAAVVLQRPPATAGDRRGHGGRGDRPARRALAGPRDRLCEPGAALRTHINVYVDRERAGLDTALEPGCRVDVIAAISGG